MFVERKSVDVTTDASGDGTGYIPVSQGRIWSIHYVKDDYATGVDFDITLEATGESLWTETDVNASKSDYPVAPANLDTGGASTLTEVPIVAAHDRIKIVVSSGGNAKTGKFIALIG
ncbi:hypothetical protein MXMO3_01811 [Maritalea myrionectae]|uniref:Uncharacterized protein n=1 Tax=Maritalea myrionectae TaxID=454601 RepID=A0A2R4MEM2_9HYPH|nr:hypothetical protein [Maritalea myrionectae]AVX04336.1 hypothetical protein MXMO3_01811 [Maritalea myrionectae]